MTVCMVAMMAPVYFQNKWTQTHSLLNPHVSLPRCYPLLFPLSLSQMPWSEEKWEMKTQVASEGEHVIMWVQLAGVSNLSLRYCFNNPNRCWKGSHFSIKRHSSHINENCVIYSPSSCSKLLLNTKDDIWRMWETKQLLVAIDFHSMGQILWKSMRTRNCSGI